MHPSIQAAVQTAQDNAPAITYTAGGSTAVLWGLHLSDIGVIVSAFATVLGVILQFYVTIHKIKMLERDQKEQARLALIAAGQGVANAALTADNAARTSVIEQKVAAVTEQLTPPLPKA